MLLNPAVGSEARIWYGKAFRRFMPFHGRRCVIVHSGRGRPRNHAVRLADGVVVVVPCGNLRPLFKELSWQKPKSNGVTRPLIR
mgnify:CR=1 FL=1